MIPAVLLCASAYGACTWNGPPTLERPRLRSASDEPLDALPQVPRLLLAGLSSISSEDLWLVRGRVTDKEQDQALVGAPSIELAERRVPLAVWGSAGGLVIAPLTVLEQSQDYTLIALGSGEVARVSTGPASSPIWWRWGPAQVTPGGWVIHCTQPPPWSVELAERASPLGRVSERVLTREQLEPGAIEVEILAGMSDLSLVDTADGELPSSGCVRFRAPRDDGTVMPPHHFAGRYFQPTALTVAERAGSDHADSVRIHVLGSAALLEAAAQLIEVTVTGPDDAMPDPSRPMVRAQLTGTAPLPLGQFAPGSYLASVATFDTHGQPQVLELPFEIEVDRGYPVLSELLGNPLGPEPASEWIEIVNVGRAELSLGGFVLEDSSGETVLPAVTLPAGGVGLIVPSDFAAGRGGDIVPHSEAIPIVVARLGDGLANSGELVRLRGPTGEVYSEIPALPAGAGQSVARRHLLAPDWPDAFGVHAAPGASPGGENEF